MTYNIYIYICVTYIDRYFECHPFHHFGPWIGRKVTCLVGLRRRQGLHSKSAGLRDGHGIPERHGMESTLMRLVV